jgi:hypothetical protein
METIGWQGVNLPATHFCQMSKIPHIDRFNGH